MMEELKPDEKELIGGWIKVGTNIEADPVLQRIEWLLDTRLQELGRDDIGWKTLYRDPRDSRFCERVYPKSYMHGGGPAALVNLSEDEAKKTFSKLFENG